MPILSDADLIDGRHVPSHLYSWLSRNDAFNYEHLIEPEIDQIMVLKDEVRLSAYLSEGKALIDSMPKDLDLYQLAAMVSWSTGCRMLLDHRVAMKSRQDIKETLFDSVIFYGDLDLLNFWLEVRRDLDSISTERLGSLESALRHIMRCRKYLEPSVFTEKARAIVKSLAAQHRSLKAAAIEQFERTDFVLKNDRLLDLQAWDVCKIFEEHNIDLRGEKKPPRMCVYEAWGSTILPIEILDTLYEAGFRDHAETSYLDKNSSFASPILSNIGCVIYGDVFFWREWKEIASMLGWFLTKGSDLHQCWPKSVTKGTHLLGWYLGNRFYAEKVEPPDENYPSSTLKEWISLQKRTSEAVTKASKDGHSDSTIVQQNTDIILWHCMKEALADMTPDTCTCHCSLAGCVPMTLFCRNFVPIWSDHGNRDLADQ